MDQLWKAMLLNGPDRTGSVSNGYRCTLWRIMSVVVFETYNTINVLCVCVIEIRELEPDNNLETQSSWCEKSNTETGSSSMDGRCLSIGQESFQSFTGMSRICYATFSSSISCWKRMFFCNTLWLLYTTVTLKVNKKQNFSNRKKCRA